jgi:DHA3 family tetracycline resistance protein-like MFS transporter
MLWVTALLIVSILSFALSAGLILAVVSLLIVGQLRGVAGLLQATWVNQKLDSRVRATIHSMFGQVDAVGQVFGGPIVGLTANMFSVRLAVGLSSLLLSPALLFIQRANGIQPGATEPNEIVSETII